MILYTDASCQRDLIVLVACHIVRLRNVVTQQRDHIVAVVLRCTSLKLESGYVPGRDVHSNVRFKVICLMVSKTSIQPKTLSSINFVCAESYCGDVDKGPAIEFKTTGDSKYFSG